MLYIDTKNNSFTHYVGMPLTDYIKIDQIVSIQADNTELEKIRREVSGIPMVDRRVVSWYGDHAKFIVANIFDI